MAGAKTERKLVCSECRTESCAAGVLMCDNASRASLIEVDRGSRRGSENRARQTMVPVRFSPDEYAVLVRAAAFTGKSHAALLRETFLTAARGIRNKEMDVPLEDED